MDRIKKLQEYQILRELEKKYDIREVKYDILNFQFEYIKDDVAKSIMLADVVAHLYQDVPKDEILLNLDQIVSEYIPEYLNQQFRDYYSQNNIELPAKLFIFKGLVQYIDADQDVYYVPFDRELEQIFQQFDKIQASK